MTQEMNKSEKVRFRCLECKPYQKPECWNCTKADEQPKQRVLNPDVAEFVNELNKRLENK